MRRPAEMSVKKRKRTVLTGSLLLHFVTQVINQEIINLVLSRQLDHGMEDQWSQRRTYRMVHAHAHPNIARLQDLSTFVHHMHNIAPLGRRKDILHRQLATGRVGSRDLHDRRIRRHWLDSICAIGIPTVCTARGSREIGHWHVTALRDRLGRRRVGERNRAFV